MTDQADQVQGMDDGMEDFAALVAQFDHAEVRDGEIVQGTILKIEKDPGLLDFFRSRYKKLRKRNLNR